MTNFFDPQLEKKPDFLECMKRIYAWYDHQVIDRVPIRFASYNAEYSIVDATDRWKDLKSRWYDVEYQVDKGLRTVENSSYLGETFPLYWPNLGPNVFAVMFGSHLEFGDVTSWASACLEDSDELGYFHFDPDNEFLKKLNELTDWALEKCKNKCLDPAYLRYRGINMTPLSAPGLQGRNPYDTRGREASLFRENLVLRRRISTEYGTAEIHITDEIENQAFHPEKLCVLYH